MSDETPPPTVPDTLVRAVLKLVPRFGDALEIVYNDTRARHAAKVAQTLAAVVEHTGVDRLNARLADDPELEALLFEALDAASRTGLEGKRRLLARVLAEAVLDDAKVEEGQLITQALRELDGPHIRALERIRIAADTLVDRPERERESAEAVRSAGQAEPTPVVAVLIRTGVVEPATLFGGGHAVHDITNFGRNLLAALRDES